MSWDLFTSAEHADAERAEADRTDVERLKPMPPGAEPKGPEPVGPDPIEGEPTELEPEQSGRSDVGAIRWVARVEEAQDRAEPIDPDGHAAVHDRVGPRRAHRQAAWPGPGAPAPDEEWSVSAVNAAAKELLEGVIPMLWVTGEIANFTHARSGHCYFTLRDDRAQLRCVMWRDDAGRLPTMPTEGMAIRALGRVTIYAGRGDLQLVVTRLEGEGDGLWKLALEQLRRRLEAEGLTAPARKRPLPRYPAVVGVVTSPSGAVFHDIVNVIRRRAPWTKVMLAGCRVQGEGAAAQVVAAIRRLTRHGEANVLIVGRGGGSAEDLQAFNEEAVARAIADSPIPVISAVGHETDVTIADLVADHRAPTPSAAAEAAVPDRADIIRGLQRDDWRLRQAIATRLGRAQQTVDFGQQRLERAGVQLTTVARDRVRVVARHLEALSPLAAFGRGYAVPLAAGRILRHRQDFEPGREFDLRIADGSIPCSVAAAHPAPPAGRPTTPSSDGGPSDP